MVKKVEVILDIDQTLAGGVVEAHMKHYNELLGLGMSDEEIEETKQYPKTFDVPEIVEFRAQGEDAEERFQKARLEIRTSEEVHKNFKRLPDSVDGVTDLLADPTNVTHHGGYFTVRPKEVETATKDWLSENGFPKADDVVICESPRDKLKKIFERFNYPDSDGDYPSVILVDDSHRQLVEAAQEIAEEDPSMKTALERLVVVGFGDEKLTASIDPLTGVRTIPLPSWEEEDVDIIETLFRKQ